MTIHRCCFALLVIAFAIFLNASPLQAQTPPVRLWQISFADQADLNRLAAELDVWEVDHAARRLLAPLTEEQAAALSESRSVLLAPDQSPLDPPIVPAAQTSGIPGFACYRTVDETYAAFDQLFLTYPKLVTQVDIGDSWDKVHAGGPPGDDLRVLVITNKEKPGPKFRFFLMAAIHAREYTTSELALRFAESLLQGYGSDANATWLLDHGELHLLPFANPDGRRIAETGQLWRKNTNSDVACQVVSPPSLTYGVDLNRNSSFQWNGCDGISCSSGNACAETYRGVSPVSEPEVAAIEVYLRKIFPDKRGPELTDSAPLDTPGLMLSLHSYGRLVLYPWGWTANHAPNAYGLATLARRIGYPLNYKVCQAGGIGCLYQTDGTTDDFSYGELGIASFTIELGTAFFQSCSDFEQSILPAGLSALRYAFSAAPLPYQLAEGPEVLDVKVAPQTPLSESHITISATADASRIAFLSGFDVDEITEPVDRIRGARLTIDQFPWSPTAYSYPFSAVDGDFNTVQEAISTTVEVACLPSGRHTLFLQAEDDAGDRGVIAAEFVTVTNTSPFSIALATTDGSTKIGNPITYTVHLTNTSATTATYTVDVQLDTPGSANVSVLPDQTFTVTAGASLQFQVVITPQNKTAGPYLPAVINVRLLSEPTRCRQLSIAPQVQTWGYIQRLVLIANE